MILRHFLNKIRLTPDRVFSVYLLKNHQGKNLSYDDWMKILDDIKKQPA